MISTNARKMKYRLEHYPNGDSLRALAGEIHIVECESFERYIEAKAYPTHRRDTPVQTSGITDRTAWLAINGRERFEREKQRNLKRLVSIYRDKERFLRIAPDCIRQLPGYESALITRHCMHGESITAIAANIGLSRATAYRKYDEAIEHFTELYEKTVVENMRQAG